MKAQQLKNAILQLAIQGKLVPQDPNDEPASELLCKIQAEKDRLIAERKIKKSKKSADKAPYAIEPPFEIPESWVWVTLEDIFYLQAGKFISASEIYNEDDGNMFPCYGGNGLRGFVKEYNRNGDYPLIGRQGALCGNINFAQGEFYATEHAVVVETFANTNVKWAIYFLIQLNLNQYATATAQPGLSVNKINNVLIPIPPLPEQHRIVQKIEELLPLVERYDQTEQKLTKLNDTFPEQLKKSVLQAAIQGKLTEQLPTDEPASELLKRIEAEKMRLISEGKLKKPRLRDNSQNTKFEPPFEIPTGWEWVRLDNYAYNFDGKRKPVSVEHRSKQKKIYDYYGATGAIDKVEDYIFNGKYILIGEDGGNFFVNRDVAFIVNGKFWANNHVHVLGTSSGLEEYLCLYLNALNLPAMGLINGIAVPKLNQQNLNSIFIAVPPLEEQKRIVEKVELLLSQIERL